MRYLLFIVLMTLAIASHAQSPISHESFTINQQYDINSAEVAIHSFTPPSQHNGWRLVIASSDRAVKVTVYQHLASGTKQQVYSDSAVTHTQFFTPEDVASSASYSVRVEGIVDGTTYRIASEDSFARPLTWTEGGRHTDITSWATPESASGYAGGDHLFYYDYQGEAATRLVRVLLKVADDSQPVLAAYQLGQLGDDYRYFSQQQHAVGYIPRDYLTQGTRIYIRISPRSNQGSQN